MQKIISLTSKDFLTGISEFPYVTTNGIWRTFNGCNPFSQVGTIQPSKAAIGLGSGTVVDLIQNFVPNNQDLYGIGAAGHFYKIATFFSGTPTVTDLRSGTLICDNTTSLPATGLEVFRTKAGTGNKIYYWAGSATSSGFIGEWDISSTYPTGWNDKKFTITNAYSESTIYPTFRIDDTIFYGAKYVVSKIYDDGTNADPAHLENILDLPKDRTITSFETDGTYLIIAATIDNSNETMLYFWDYKNKLDSWTISHSIKDNISQLKNVAGVIYAIGTAGLYAFNSATEPTKVRTDIKSALSSYYKIMSRYNDALFIGTSGGIKSYGKVLPNLKSGVFTPFTTVAKAMIIPPYITGNPNRLFCSSGTVTLSYLDILSLPSTTPQSVSLQTAVIDLGNSFKIKRIDIVFANRLASGEGITSIVAGYGENDITFNSPAYSSYGATRKVKLFPISTSGDMITDMIDLTISEGDDTKGFGTNSIKRIDIYGERAEY